MAYCDTLPSHHRALVLSSRESGFTLQSLPTPPPSPGSAIVRIAVSGTLSYFRELYNGTLSSYSFPTPLVGGYCGIGHIAAIGADATLLHPGQLVYVDCVVRARDDPDEMFLMGIHDGQTPGAKKLMEEVWRNATLAEFVKVPLENCFRLDETKLCSAPGGLGYQSMELMYLAYLLVPYGGLRDIGIQPGETVVVCPATGGFGCAAVMVAIAMGARVIAVSRNDAKLQKLKAHVTAGSPGANLETLTLTGDEAADTAAIKSFGPIDAALDLSPHAAQKSGHLKSIVSCLKRNGRVSLMGMVQLDLPAWTVVGKNIALRGKLMYEREDVLLLVKMLENGMFPRGKDFVEVQAFGLGEWEEGFEAAKNGIGVGTMVVFTP